MMACLIVSQVVHVSPCALKFVCIVLMLDLELWMHAWIATLRAGRSRVKLDLSAPAAIKLRQLHQIMQPVPMAQAMFETDDEARTGTPKCAASVNLAEGT